MSQKLFNFQIILQLWIIYIFHDLSMSIAEVFKRGSFPRGGKSKGDTKGKTFHFNSVQRAFWDEGFKNNVAKASKYLDKIHNNSNIEHYYIVKIYYINYRQCIDSISYACICMCVSCLCLLEYFF